MLKVLIADDSQVIRMRVARIINEVDGAELIGEASNGQETIDFLQQVNPDILILDFRMPDINGVQVLEKIRKTNQDLVVIILTAFPYPQVQEKCSEAGANYFLDKSHEFVNVADLLEKIVREKNGESVIHG